MTSPAQRYRQNIRRQSGAEPSVVDQIIQVGIAERAAVLAQHRAGQKVPVTRQPRRVVEPFDPRLPREKPE